MKSTIAPITMVLTSGGFVDFFFFRFTVFTSFP